MSLARRTVISTSWNLIANSVSVVVLAIRSILLARWLPVEVFGIYSFAVSIVGLSSTMVSFGMGPAFLHRAPETADEEQAAAVHFTLKLLFTLVWVGLLVAAAFMFTSGPNRVALAVLAVTGGGVQLAETPKLMLTRRVVHRRLALIELTSVVLATLLALGLAWRGATLWALLAIDLVGATLPVIALYVWRPVWRPRLAWVSAVVRYFLSFGNRSFLVSALAVGLDNIDNLWTGRYLGKTALGYYSRAYAFATYPRTILAAPINMVVGGTLAELKGNRVLLSRAFFRVNALLVRSGFFLAGLLALIAPEFIRLALGNKWLPMLDAFRLMLVFMMLDPLRKTIAHLFVAVGKPEQIAYTYLIQLGVLLAGLFAFGLWSGVSGVAVAVNVMLAIGIAILLWRARAYIDISLTRLFAVPALALIVAVLLARGAVALPGVLGSDWRTGLVKCAIFATTYGAILLLFEGRQIAGMLSWLTGPLAGMTLSGSGRDQPEVTPHSGDPQVTAVPWDQPVSDEAAQTALQLSGITPGSDVTRVRVLDFGCGNGRYLEVFARYIPKENLYGVEISPQRAAQANRKGFRILLLGSQHSCLPLKSASFDLVFSSNVIEHVPRKLYLLYLVEIHRILKPGGRFVVGTPNYPIKRLYDVWSALTTRFTRYYLFDDPTHCNKLSIYELERDLARIFREIHLEPTYLFMEGRIVWLRNPRVRRHLRGLSNKIIGYCVK